MSYVEYYDRTIREHAKGFKLVPGGTGLGKTSRIAELVTKPEYAERKFIYIANRHQLLEEMAKAKALRSNQVVFLRRDLEVVLHTLKNQATAFYSLLEDPGLSRLFERSGKLGPATIRRAAQLLEQLGEFKESMPKLLEQQSEAEAGKILNGFKAVLLSAKGNKRYEWLFDHLVIHSLFPLIAFKRRPEARLLLVTLHKAFHGFFDGETRINLTGLRDYVIFLDEFDFLENDLIRLICKTPQIDAVFKFVELFYSEMSRHKLPLPTYPTSTQVEGDKLRERINNVVKTIKTLRRRGIRYPEINQFIRGAASKKESGDLAIFRTNHIVSTKPLYLIQAKRAFEVVVTKEAASGGKAVVEDAHHLFRTVSRAAEQILTLLKTLELEDKDTYEEIRRQCYEDTDFYDQLERLAYFPRQRKQQPAPTQLSALLNSGYQLYDVQQLDQHTDREEVKLRNYGIFVTPEKLLASLVQDNLVFGLSATADIPRCIHHFNLDWLRSQDGLNFINLDAADIELIGALNAEKAAVRKTELSVFRLAELGETDPVQKGLQEFIEAVAGEADFGRGPDSKEGHRKRRIARFFAALEWICNNPDASAGPSHLMFLNSFLQLKVVLEQYAHLAGDLFRVTKREPNDWFEVYDLNFRGRSFIVVFYDAEQAKRIRRQKEVQAAFDGLFGGAVPVIVVTQYLSAGNGVNLQYAPVPEEPTKKSDFLNLHLLEAPYFYFVNPDQEQGVDEKIAGLKENIWYQAKLYAGKYIGEARFKQVLGTLHKPDDWNTRYQQDAGTRADALLNNLATFIQALGRIEREWRPTPRQSVVLGGEVYQCFQAFLGPDYDYLREGRERLISDNLKQLFSRIRLQMPQRERELRDTKDSRPAARNTVCRDRLQGLVTSLEKVRAGAGNAGAIRNDWQQLRRAVLRHDFQNKLLEQYACTCESSLFQNGLLWLNELNEIIPPSLARSGVDYRWRLDSIYDLIAGNRIIGRYFSERGFEMAFGSASGRFFTPYCYQAILAGAIGEEACTALLQHEGISLEDVPNPLFELADLKVKGVPYYIDCKNYTDATMQRFVLPADDLMWHPKLNEQYFKERAEEKLGKISDYHAMEDGKLIYLNLASRHERPLAYYDAEFRPVDSFAEARLIVVQGCLEKHRPNSYQAAFVRFLGDLQADLLQNQLQPEIEI